MPKRLRTLSEVGEALQRLEAFESDNVTAVRCDGNPRLRTSDLDNWYSVYSYSTLIMRMNLDTGDVVYFDGEFISHTTTRIQKILRALFMVEIATYLDAKEDGYR